MKTKRFTLAYILPVFALGLVLPLAANAATPGVETFDSDTAGFIPNTTSSVVVHGSPDGNPGGHLLIRKSLQPPAFDVGAMTLRPDFTGDFAADGIAGASVDLNFLTDNVTSAWLRFRPDIFNNGWLIPLTAAFPTKIWNTYTVAFDPTWTDVEAHANGWLTDKEVNPLAIASPSFADVMSSIDMAEVRIASDGSTLVALDNFRLIGSHATPDSSSLAVDGLALISIFAMGRRYYR